MRAIGLVAFTLGLLALSSSCARRPVTRPGTTTTTSANLVPDETALQRITIARCKREQGCARIGDTHPYATWEECKRELGAGTRAAYPAEDCGRGMRDAALSLCLSDIGNEWCGTSIDTPPRIPSCTKSALCR